MFCAMNRIKVLTSVSKDPEIAQKRAIIGAFDPLRKSLITPQRGPSAKKKLALHWAMVKYTLLASFGCECPADRAQTGKNRKTRLCFIIPRPFVKWRGVFEWTASASAAAVTYKWAYISEDTKHRLLNLKI
jgi:hypothetical protein